MTSFNIEIPKHRIADSFSRWAALSALRSGSPLKSREDIYTLLNAVNFKSVLSGSTRISRDDFEKWHRDALMIIKKRSANKLSIGWAAKIINVYLKSMTYLSGIGRPELIKHIHPPIDAGLWNGLKKFCKDHPEIRDKIYCKTTIKEITRHADYLRIIEGFRQVANEDSSLLIEVEKYWIGATLKERKQKTIPLSGKSRIYRYPKRGNGKLEKKSQASSK